MSTVISLIALFIALTLLGRVKRLEQLVAGGARSVDVDTKTTIPDTSVLATTPVTPVRPESVSEPLVSVPSTSSEPSFVSEVIDWMAKDWLMKLGAVLLFLGIGWIVTTFFWDAIGPVGHVAIGFFIGIILLVFGKGRIHEHHHQGGVFVALGAGIIYLTSYVASPVSYNLISPTAAIGFMFLTAVFVTYLAVVTRIYPVALLGLLLGLVAPYLSGSNDPSFVQLFSYLLFLSVGTLWVSTLTKWRSLTLLSIVAYGIYALPYLGNSGVLMGDSLVAMLVIMLGTLYFVVGLSSVVNDRTVVPADLWVTGINSLIALSWIHVLIPTAYGRALFCTTVAVVASAGAFIVYRNTRLQEPVAVHTLSSAAFLVAATAYVFDGPLFRLVIMMEATGAIMLWRLFFGAEVARKAAWVSIAPIALGTISLFEYAYASSLSFSQHSPVVFDENFAVVIVAISLLVMYSYLFRESLSREDKNVTLSQLFVTVGSIMTLVFFWFFAQRLMPGDGGTMLSLFVYTLVGLFLYISGKLGVREKWKVPGALILAFVVGHLLLVDIGGMDTVGRIITFTLVGLLLISTSFIHKKEKTTGL